MEIFQEKQCVGSRKISTFSGRRFVAGSTEGPKSILQQMGGIVRVSATQSCETEDLFDRDFVFRIHDYLSDENSVNRFSSSRTSVALYTAPVSTISIAENG